MRWLCYAGMWAQLCFACLTSNCMSSCEICKLLEDVGHQEDQLVVECILLM